MPEFWASAIASCSIKILRFNIIVATLNNHILLISNLNWVKFVSILIPRFLLFNETSFIQIFITVENIWTKDHWFLIFKHIKTLSFLRSFWPRLNLNTTFSIQPNFYIFWHWDLPRHLQILSCTWILYPQSRQFKLSSTGCKCNTQWSLKRPHQTLHAL